MNNSNEIGKVENETRFYVMRKYLVHIIWAVIAVIALVGGIFYGKGSVANSTASSAGATRGAYGRTGAAGGLVLGQIVSINGQSMIVSLANGNSEVVFYSTSTQISEPTIVSASSLATGTMVMVGGTSNSDGSLTAQSIQVRSGGSFGGSSGGSGNSQ